MVVIGFFFRRVPSRSLKDHAGKLRVDIGESFAAQRARLPRPEVERDVLQRVLDFPSISIRAIAVIEGGKSVGRRSGWPFRFNGPRLKRPVSVLQPRALVCARVSAQYRFFERCDGGARLPGLSGITGELSPIGKKAKCFPLEQRRGTSERYIHKCLRDARHCACARDLPFLLVVSRLFLFFSIRFLLLFVSSHAL